MVNFSEVEIFVFQKQLQSNAYNLKTIQESLNSFSNILTENTNDINSIASILSSGNENSLSQNSTIKVITEASINSNTQIQKTYQRTLESYCEIYVPTSQKTLTSDAWISLRFSNALSSYLQISAPDISESFDDGWQDVAEEPEFEKVVSYIRYDMNYDNMTGDIDKDTYSSVSIYAEVQPLEITDKVIKSGEMKIGDAEIFLPARILTDSSGDAVKPSFRPQIDDDIVFRGIRYRIAKIVFERIGTTEIFADCMCKRVENAFPEEKWNDSYCDEYSKPGQPGKGWT